MELGKWREWIIENWNKYKYVLIILLIGVVFMLQPQEEATQNMKTEEIAEELELEEQLEDILMNIQGAGKVMVLLSVEKGESITYQTDVTESNSVNGSDHRSQTVLITDDARNETGLVHQKVSPVYQGAIILAQGANDPKIKLSIVEAVSKVTGLGASEISVLKMK